MNENIPAPIMMITLQGYTLLGDCDPFQHKRVAAPATPKRWHFQSLDGAWWELCTADANVLHLGAKGDVGIASSPSNDQPAFQASTDYLASRPSGGGRVLYPARGYFIASGSVTTSVDSITHQGLSSGGTYGPGALIYATNGSADIFVWHNDNNQVAGGGLRDLGIAGAYGNVRKGGGNAIANRITYRVNHENLLIFSCANGLECYGTNNTTIRCVSFEDVKGEYAIKFWGDLNHRSDVLQLHVVSMNCKGQSNGIIWDGYAHTLDMISVKIIQPLRGFWIRNTAGDANRFPQFGNIFGLEIDGATGSCLVIEAGRNIYFHLAQMYGAANDHAVQILADLAGSIVDDIQFHGGRIGGSAYDCIYVDARDVYFFEVNASGGSRAAPGQYNGFHLGPNSRNVQIHGGGGGNVFGDTTFHGYAVRIEPGAQGYKIIGLNTDNCINGRVLDGSNDPNGIILASDQYHRFGANPYIGSKAGNTSIFGDNVFLQAGGANVAYAKGGTKAFRLVPRSTPSNDNGERGDLIADASTGRLNYHDGTSWGALLHANDKVFGDGSGSLRLRGGDDVRLEAGSRIFKVTPDGDLVLPPTGTGSTMPVGAIHYDQPSGSFKLAPPSGPKTIAYKEDLDALAARVMALGG